MIAPMFAQSLGLTLLLEAGFFLLVVKYNKKDFMLLVLVNILTNPIVVLLYWLASVYTDLHRAIIIIPLEIFAIVVEWQYYKKYGQNINRPFLFAFSANMFSYWIGVLIQLLV